MNNTLKSLTDFATNTGRLTFDVWGDSTAERNGGGHSVGFAAGVFGIIPCAGQLIPVNTTTIYNDTGGLIECRRRNNASTKVGAVNDIGVDAVGYPLSFKQYGCQIPVPAAGGYIGPQVGYYPGTRLDIEISASYTGPINVTASTAGFPTTGRIRMGGEIIQYTAVSATGFQGTISRGNLNSTAVGHSAGTIIGQCDNGTAVSSMVSAARHPIGSGTVFVQSLFYMTNMTGGSTGSAEIRLSYDNQASSVNTDTSYTPLTYTRLNGAINTSVTSISATGNTGFPASGSFLVDTELISYSSVTVTGFQGCTRAFRGGVAASHSNGATASYAECFDLMGSAYTIGSLHRVDAGYSGSDLTVISQPTLNIGTQAFASPNGLGPAGPAAFMFQGLFAKNRPYGGIQSKGNSQGGKTLNNLIKSLRNYDATNNVCEYDAGLVSRYKIYGTDADVGVAAGAIGGNGVAGYCQVTAFGHNESTNASDADTSLVDSTESWTILVRASLAGLGITNSTSTGTITLSSTTGLNTGGGHVLIDNERINYTGIAGSTITGITRGVYGTTGVSHAIGASAYQGYLTFSPRGFASDLLFDYKLKKAKWIEAGGSSSRFWYIWVRPIPISSTLIVVDDDSTISSPVQATAYASKEYRFNRYAAVIQEYLGYRDGFILADTSSVISGGEALSYDLGGVPGLSGDQVHNTNVAYVQAWHRLVAREVGSGYYTHLRSRGW